MTLKYAMENKAVSREQCLILDLASRCVFAEVRDYVSKIRIHMPHDLSGLGLLIHERIINQVAINP